MAISAIMMEAASATGRDAPVTRQLAPREREVLHLLSTGRPYKQIAAELELSIGTIRTYVRRLYGKLHVNCRTEAVVKYLTVMLTCKCGKHSTLNLQPRTPRFQHSPLCASSNVEG